jgi:excisionase family DNA binding protein
MSSNIYLDKTCQHCGNHFVARTTVTQYCSDNCAKKAYKARGRVQKIQASIDQENKNRPYNPVINQKEFLSIQETAQLTGASRWTIYRLIQDGRLKAGKLRRRTVVKRAEIDKLFN